MDQSVYLEFAVALGSVVHALTISHPALLGLKHFVMSSAPTVK